MCSLIHKYHIPGPRYTSYPTLPYWDLNSFSGKKWEETAKKSFETTNNEDGISLYIHLPFCESMCAFCGCHKRITKRHDVELPYIKSVLREWAFYVCLFTERPIIKELHLGGGTPTFFNPEHLKMLIEGIVTRAELAPDYEFSFEGHPDNTTKEHLQFKQLQEVMDRLDEISQDALLEINTCQLKIKAKGRPFVRNICMAFDLKLHENAPNTRLFSITV